MGAILLVSAAILIYKCATWIHGYFKSQKTKTDIHKAAARAAARAATPPPAAAAARAATPPPAAAAARAATPPPAAAAARAAENKAAAEGMATLLKQFPLLKKFLRSSNTPKNQKDEIGRFLLQIGKNAEDILKAIQDSSLKIKCNKDDIETGATEIFNLLKAISNTETSPRLKIMELIASLSLPTEQPPEEIHALFGAYASVKKDDDLEKLHTIAQEIFSPYKGRVSPSDISVLIKRMAFWSENDPNNQETILQEIISYTKELSSHFDVPEKAGEIFFLFSRLAEDRIDFLKKMKQIKDQLIEKLSKGNPSRNTLLNKIENTLRELACLDVADVGVRITERERRIETFLPPLPTPDEQP